MSARIKEARLARNWSQQELADRVRVSQPTIVHWEQGTHAPRNMALARLAEALGVSRQWLQGAGEPQPAPVAHPPPRSDPSVARPYWARPLHHVAVHKWPVDMTALADMLAGRREPADFMPYSGEPDHPLALIVDDPAVRQMFPAGCMAVIDAGERSLEDGRIYVVEARGRPALRRWRIDPMRMEADTLDDTQFHDTPPQVFGRVLLAAKRL
jgi:transcriptional regulator with XRE-family HTH domain